MQPNTQRTMYIETKKTINISQFYILYDEKVRLSIRSITFNCCIAPPHHYSWQIPNVGSAVTRSAFCLGQLKSRKYVIPRRLRCNVPPHTQRECCPSSPWARNLDTSCTNSQRGICAALSFATCSILSDNRVDVNYANRSEQRTTSSSRNRQHLKISLARPNQSHERCPPDHGHEANSPLTGYRVSRDQPTRPTNATTPNV